MSIEKINNITPIVELNKIYDNKIFIKRDDFISFSFGGNKARKGRLFLEDIKIKKCNYIVTYGSSSSNHCRVIANMAISENIPCCIISPQEIKCETFNKKMMEMFKAKVIFCELAKVHETIESTIEKLRLEGYKPYFIQGGGHGNLGTKAYVECFEEIIDYEKYNKIKFDYIFHASGTGTTQAGLICGNILNKNEKKIVGISIARKSSYGFNIIEESIKEYLKNSCLKIDIRSEIIFEDEYLAGGYGKSNKKIDEIISEIMRKYGVPLDKTYTGKAFWGMNEYLLKNNIKNKNILFIHTGGTPLFFDYLKER